MTALVMFLAPYTESLGFNSPGDIGGLPDAIATELVAAGQAILYDAGGGLGIPTASPFRGQIASETNAQYIAAGGNPDDVNPSAAIEGYQGDVTIERGHATPNSEPWA